LRAQPTATRPADRPLIPDVRYFPIALHALIRAGTCLDDIACDCSIDHADFDAVLSPLFERMLVRLLDADLLAGRMTKDPEFLRIARVPYRISAAWKGEWLKFSVEALRAFDECEPDDPNTKMS
jgi:hypothetical protein